MDDADAKDSLVSALVTDALAAVDPDGLDAKAADAYALLAWWPGRTSSPRTAPTARTGGGGSHGRSPRTG